MTRKTNENKMPNCIFFPFSHINSYQEKIIDAFLSQCSYLSLEMDVQNMGTAEPNTNNSFMEPIFLPSKEISRVRQQIKSFQSWASLHQENKKNIRAFLDQKVWLSDPENTSGIISQIKKQQKASSGSINHAPKSHMENLLFLELMRMMDQENQSIDYGLRKVKKKEEAIFAQLRGETQEETPSDVQYHCPREPGNFMTEKQVFAWWNIAEQKGLLHGTCGDTSPLILFTTSPDVYKFCTRYQEDVTNALDIDSIKVHEDRCPHKGQWQINFLQYLQGILTGKDMGRNIVPDTCNNCCTKGYIRFQILSEIQKLSLSQGRDDFKKRQIGMCLIGLGSIT